MDEQQYSSAELANYYKRILEDVNQEELEVFDDVIDLYEKDPSSLHQQGTRSGGLQLLGGIDITLYTPIIIEAMKVILPLLLTQVFENKKEELGRRLQAQTDKVLPKKTLTDEQYKMIEAAVIKEAREKGLSGKKARALAKSIVGNLALANEEMK
jgi:hypothetical protein